MSGPIVVLSSCDSAESARKTARHLLERRLAACVNIVPGATSIYWRKGALEESAEWLLLIKTHRSLLERVEAELRGVHPYEVPELIALDITAGSQPYLNWLDRELGLQP